LICLLFLHSLELNTMTNQYQSFYDLLSNALQLLIEKQYKLAIIKASQDELYIHDIKSVKNTF